MKRYHVIKTRGSRLVSLTKYRSWRDADKAFHVTAARLRDWERVEVWDMAATRHALLGTGMGPDLAKSEARRVDRIERTVIG